MCGVLFTWWVGRKNNGAIVQSDVRGSAVNTRVVKLAPVKGKEAETIAGKETVPSRIEIQQPVAS